MLISRRLTHEHRHIHTRADTASARTQLLHALDVVGHAASASIASLAKKMEYPGLRVRIYFVEEQGMQKCTVDGHWTPLS